MFSEPIYIPRALNTGTCLRQGDLFYSAGLHRNHVLASQHRKNQERFYDEAGAAMLFFVQKGRWKWATELYTKEPTYCSVLF